MKSKEIKYILGLHYVGHDASASLIKDGEVIASVMEERFSGIKKDRSFPINAVNFCLKYADITIDDIDVITFNTIAKIYFDHMVVHYLGKHYPKSVPLFEGLLNKALKLNGAEKEIRDRLNYHKEIYFCKHHDAHVSISFFLSLFGGSYESGYQRQSVVMNNDPF